MLARIVSLHIYPVKSCGGITLDAAKVTATGLEFDRHWMVINAQGRFITQREQPKLALIATQLIDNKLDDTTLRLSAPGQPSIDIEPRAHYTELTVTVWRDTLLARDEGDVAAAWFSHFLGNAVRLVRFSAHACRQSSSEWTGDTVAFNQFADGYSMLAISEASLSDLNSRLSQPLPMNRFRPNLVLANLAPYDEDRVYELQHGDLKLRVVKPCTRCKITTTEQSTGEVQGDEPLKTLKSYRWNESLRGIAFGQNIIVAAGIGAMLRVQQDLEVTWR